jgi:hypothetical protein
VPARARDPASDQGDFNTTSIIIYGDHRVPPSTQTAFPEPAKRREGRRLHEPDVLTVTSQTTGKQTRTTGNKRDHAD